jgi:hypothetical protein
MVALEKAAIFFALKSNTNSTLSDFTCSFCFVTEFYTYPNEYCLPLRTNFSV